MFYAAGRNLGIQDALAEETDTLPSKVFRARYRGEKFPNLFNGFLPGERSLPDNFAEDIFLSIPPRPLLIINNFADGKTME